MRNLNKRSMIWLALGTTLASASATTKAESPQSNRQFVRLVNTTEGQPESLQTAVSRYTGIVPR